MCKTRIEKAALKTKGVKYAQWNPETQKLSAIINSNKTNIRTIAINISAVGHQASEFPVDYDIYNSLPPCCQYRDPNAKKMHKMDMKKSKN
jgi:cation transport ATPase